MLSFINADYYADAYAATLIRQITPLSYLAAMPLITLIALRRHISYAFRYAAFATLSYAIEISLIFSPPLRHYF